MSAVSETIVREYFELHGFLVRQQRKFVATGKGEDEEVDFFVVNPRPRTGATPPFVLASGDLATVARAMVVVRGWHTETFSLAVLENAPEMFRFVDPVIVQRAARGFDGNAALTKILVVPALPQDAQARARSVELMQKRGVDAVIPFRTMLADLIACVETNRNYQKADLLQVLRILKNYDFLREPQLELFKPSRARRKPAAPENAG